MSTPTSTSTSTARELPRWSLTIVAGAHALLFGWAGTNLPWSEWSPFTIVCYLLALGHTLTAVAAALQLRALTAIWRACSVFALLTLGWLAWELTSAASYLAGLYGELGEGLGTALLAGVAAGALPIVPLSSWGLAATWRPSFNKGTVAATPLLLLVWTLGAMHEAEQAHASELPLPGEFGPLDRHADSSTNPLVEQQLFDTFDREIGDWGKLPEIPTEGPIHKVEGGYRHAQLRVPSLMTSEPIACVPDPESGQSVAVLTYLKLLDDPPKRPKRDAPVEVVSRCVRAAPDDIYRAIAQHVLANSLRGPVKIDVVRGVAPLHSRGRAPWRPFAPILETLALRPGVDGVCDETHCLMPWQLVALEQFTNNEPLPWIPDFRYGISPVELRLALGFEVPEQVVAWDREQRHPGRIAYMEKRGEQPTPRPDDAEVWRQLDGLTRLETLSYVFVGHGQFFSLVRMRQREFEMTKRRLDHARGLAERHIADAQLERGVFRYLLDPFTGDQQARDWNLPRQAGTTLVMCELGQDQARTEQVAAHSLKFMAERARESGDRIALIKDRKSSQADLGSTALPTIAFLACRPRVGSTHDSLIAGLARFLLGMQRDDGGFHPVFDVEASAVIEGPEPMYAGGQAIFALSLAEQLALDEPEAAAAAGLPSAELLHDAVERAMNFYTGPYWDTFVRDFFWLEENWHCLAARASLAHHRNDAYERFCLDYMTYKAQVLLDEASGVAPEFVGGYSMGNILVPVNTPAAGYGEGLAAAMSIKQARGEPIDEDRERMRAVIKFLVRQQWTRASCFACTPDRTVVGGFSESMAAPEIRIDFTQHSWAALGHGGAWIYDELPDTHPSDPTGP